MSMLDYYIIQIQQVRIQSAFKFISKLEQNSLGLKYLFKGFKLIDFNIFTFTLFTGFRNQFTKFCETNGQFLFPILVAASREHDKLRFDRLLQITCFLIKKSSEYRIQSAVYLVMPTRSIPTRFLNLFLISSCFVPYEFY